MKNQKAREQLQQKFRSWKEELSLQKERTEEIENLIKKKIKHHYQVNLWELSEDELDKEMGARLSFLNQGIDSVPKEKITSHRKIIGVLIVFLKKIMRKALQPFFLRLFFEKQKRFNEDTVNYQLATFIRFRLIEKKLEELEQIIVEIKDNQEAVHEEIKSIAENLKKNEPG